MQKLINSINLNYHIIIIKTQKLKTKTIFKMNFTMDSMIFLKNKRNCGSYEKKQESIEN